MHHFQLHESPINLEDFQQSIGYQFRNINLLKQALTRQSAIEEGRQLRTIGSFQRLEFLGDKVLNLSVSQLLFHYHPDWPEGRLTQETARFVNNQGPLSTIARKWKLGNLLIVGRGEQLLNIKENNKALGDAVEAILGAILEDSDSDYKLVKKLIAQHWATIGLAKPHKFVVVTNNTVNEQETLADIIFNGDSLEQRQKIKALLSHSVSKQDLEYAVINGYQEIEILKLLCTQSIDKAILNQALFESIRQSLVPQVSLLLASGAEANSVHECRDEYWSGGEPCIGDPYTVSALQLAVNTYGDEAVTMATELLRHGANANWQEGTTQITHYQKRIMTIGELLKNPPKVEIKKDKITALHMIVSGDNHNKESLISLLINQGHADPNLKNAEGNTPLHEATYSCYLDTSIYDLLVSLGANQDVENDKRQTPRQLRRHSIDSWKKSVRSMSESFKATQLLFSKNSHLQNNINGQTPIEPPATSAAWPKASAASDVIYTELRTKQNNDQPTPNLPPPTEQPRL